MNRLHGKYALITGASQGLGRQLALAYAHQGAPGLAIVARGTELLNQVRDRIAEIAPDAQVLVITADLTKTDEIERVVATTLNQFNGHLDVLVNNASALSPSPMPYLLD